MLARVSFWLLVSMIAAIGVAKAVLSDTFDPDLFWHLKVADQLHRDGIGPLVDQLSFASIKDPWTPYSWLAELGMKGLWDVFGWRISIIGEAAMVAALVALIAKSCLNFAGRDRLLNCVVATVVASFLSIPFLSFRPITFAIVLLAIVAWLLFRDRAREQKTRAVWTIVPLTLLLANVHLSVIVVPIWLGCLLIGAAWERDKRSMRRYGVLLVVCGITSLMTPMLPGAIHAAWFYQSSDVMVASRIIAEMQPAYVGMAIAAFFILAGLRRRHEIRAGEWLMLAATGILMLRLGRFSPIFALVAAPIIARTFPTMADRVLTRRPIAAMLAAALLVFAVRITLGFPINRSMDDWMNRRGSDLPGYPTEAAAYVEKNVTPQTGRLINEFNWGGYLAWRLGDCYQVLLDGRTQLFTQDFWRSTYLGTEEQLKQALAGTTADAAILPARKSRFHDALVALGWQIVHTDKFAEVLIPPAK